MGVVFRQVGLVVLSGLKVRSEDEGKVAPNAQLSNEFVF